MEVHVKNLSFAYSQKSILQNLNLQVASGEIVGILGINGAGKSTLLKLLCGLLPLQQGFINEIPKEHLGVVFQESSLDPRLTGLENLRLFADLYGHASVPKAVEGLDLNLPVKKLSGGQKRRLELARVLVHRPQLLLMDEPTTGLDVQACELFWRNLRASGATVLMNTHKAEEAERCDRLIVLHEGEVLLSESPEVFKKRVSEDRIVLSLKGKTEPVIVFANEGHKEIPRLVESYQPGQVESVQLYKPSLTDAFLKVTGVPLT